MRRLSIKVAFPLFLGIASSVAVACGDNNTPSDTDTDSTDISEDGGGEPGSGGRNGDGSGATSNDGAGGGSGGSTDGAGGNNGGEGGQTNTGGNGAGGGSGGFIVIDEPDCPEEANGTFADGDNEGEACWDHAECKGVASEQFLNRCSGTCLEFFDNEQRIVGFDGDLPPL